MHFLVSGATVGPTLKTDPSGSVVCPVLTINPQERESLSYRVQRRLNDGQIFFEAKALNDRASTLSEKKDGIDQAVSSVSVALEAVNAVDSIVEQLKGIAISAQSASTAAESER